MIGLFLKKKKTNPISELARCAEEENRDPEGESELEITRKTFWG